MAKALRHLLLVTVEDPFDARSWSGTAYALRTALERRIPKVTTFRPSRPRRTLLAGLLRLVFGSRRRPLWISNPTLRRNAREVWREIRRTQPDAVLSISSQCMALLGPQRLPLFLFSDAPYLAFLEAYRRWETAPDAMPRFAALEAAVAARSSGLFFGSAWACAEAERLYGLSTSEAGRLLHVAPFGANSAPSLSRDEVLRRAEERGFDRMELLFIGRDWERKGGPLAVAVAETLHRAGQPVTLHIVGCEPALDKKAASVVTIHGLLRQNVAAERQRLTELLLDSHFLLVPTLAECFGIVFAEAHAFALPPISRAVHALPSVVLDGETGLLLPPDAPAEAYAERLRALFQQPEHYRRMARQARLRFESVLNWDHTADVIASKIEDALRHLLPPPEA